MAGLGAGLGLLCLLLLIVLIVVLRWRKRSVEVARITAKMANQSGPNSFMEEGTVHGSRAELVKRDTEVWDDIDNEHNSSVQYYLDVF